MARRAGALTSIVAPASLALALSLAIALAALAPAAADQPAKSDGAGTGAEVAEPAEGGAEQTAAERRAARKAERTARHSERALSQGEAAPASEDTPAPAPGGAAAGGTDASSKATRRAERAVQRAARRAASAAPVSTKNSSRAAAGSKPAAAKSKGAPTEQELQKRREREERRQRTGHETRKEKQARQAREEREGQEAADRQLRATTATPGGATTVIASAVGLAPASTPEARASAAIPPSIAAERAVRSSRPARGKAGREGVAQVTAGLAAGALPVGPVVTARTPAKSPGASGRRHRTQPAARASSPLVTTVTRIIGVIPTALWLLIGALAFAAAAFATTSRLTARRARRLERQRSALLEDVGLLQAALLPELPGRLGAVTTAAAYRPASGPGAGGDFYDVFALREGLVAVVVGDVSGHGRDALPHTTLLRYTLRAYLEAGLTPREALRAAAPALERQLGGSFATVVLATYDPRARRLTYSCAGHPHPLLTGMDPEAGNIACSAPPIGTGRPTGTRQTVVSVPGAALAAFYTDGVIEARTGGELYGQRRLGGALEALDGSGDAVAAQLLDVVREQTERRPDDMAACVLGIDGGDELPRIVCEELVLDPREARRARRFLLKAGVGEEDLERIIEQANAIAVEHGSVLIGIDTADGTAHVSLTHDNVAPLRARALARTQEVAL
jgi:serine phosphatase RsbU (regulator of sigma subunit)